MQQLNKILINWWDDIKPMFVKWLQTLNLLMQEIYPIGEIPFFVQSLHI